MEAAAAAQHSSAHISHLQQARCFHTGGPWLSTGRGMTPHTNKDFCSAPGLVHTHAPDVRRPGFMHAKTAWIYVNSNFFFLHGRKHFSEDYFLQPELEFVSESQVNTWFYSLFLWPFGVRND